MELEKEAARSLASERERAQAHAREEAERHERSMADLRSHHAHIRCAGWLECCAVEWPACQRGPCELSVVDQFEKPLAAMLTLICRCQWDALEAEQARTAAAEQERLQADRQRQAAADADRLRHAQETTK